MLGWSPQRRNRAILVAALAVMIFLALRAARGALFPYVLALVLAYLMLPAVNWLETNLRRFGHLGHASRPLAILLVYLAFIGLVAWFFSIVVPIVMQQFGALWDSRDVLTSRTQELTQQGWTWYHRNVPEQIQTQVDDNVRRASGTALDALQVGATTTLTVVTSTLSWFLGLAVIPFWLFYVLYDRAKAVQAMHNMVPDRWWSDARNLIGIADRVMGAYVRGQLLLSAAIGIMAFVGLVYLKVPFPALLALMAAVFEMFPFIGPILGAIPAVILAAVQSPILGLWTALFFMAIQQIESTILAPRIAGNAVKLHPAIIMVVLVIGNEVAGLWGMLVAVPLTAIIRDAFRYLFMRFQDEPVSADEALARLWPSERGTAPPPIRIVRWPWHRRLVLDASPTAGEEGLAATLMSVAATSLVPNETREMGHGDEKDKLAQVELDGQAMGEPPERVAKAGVEPGS
jgi:predicted PurR-regulated permease PerM